MSEYINLTPENIEDEHLCCIIRSKTKHPGVEAKRLWLKERITEGHVFRKLNVKGKVFVEYAPLESAWTPISGNNFLYIYCLWVSGSYSGKGYAKELLEYVIEEAKKKGKNGICTISSKKKKPFLSEKKFFVHHGFQVVDTNGDYELLSLSWNHQLPKFHDSARKMEIEDKEFTIFYSPACPYVENGIHEIEEYAKEKNIPLNLIKIDTLEKAKQVPCIFNNWAFFIDGKFVSNTLLNQKSFMKIITK